METVCISHNDFPSIKPGNELYGCVTIATYTEVLDNAERNARGCAEKPKCYGQLLTMMAKGVLLLLLIQIMECKSCVGHIACLLQLSSQFLQLCIDLFELRV